MGKKLSREVFEQRMLAKRRIDENGCWIWTGRTINTGRGTINDPFAPGNQRTTVHRVAAMLWLGFDPASGLHVLHHCDNPPCFNPDHLFIGTHADNMRDMAEKGRAATRRGEDHHLAVLDETDVKAIRSLRQSGWLLRELGARFGVTMAQISYICLRKNWRHI